MAGHNHTCCDKQKVRRGLWTPEEDEVLRSYINKHGQGCWTQVPKKAGLERCGKSCRLRWINYLRPDLKRGDLTPEEVSHLIKLHAIFGNRWSLIVKHFPGRTDNEIKNVWNSSIKNKIWAHCKAAKSKSRKPSGDFPVHAVGTVNHSQNLSFIKPTNNMIISNAPMPIQGFVPNVPPPLPPPPTYIPITNTLSSISNLPTWPDFSYNPQSQVLAQNDSSLFEYNDPAFFDEVLQFLETFDGVTNFPPDVSTSNAGVNYPSHLENIESLMGFYESSTPSAPFAASSSTTTPPLVDLRLPIAEASSSLSSADVSSLAPLPCSGPFMWENYCPESWEGLNESSTPSAAFVASSSSTATPPLVDLGLPIASSSSSSLPSADVSSLAPLPCSGPFMWENYCPESWVFDHMIGVELYHDLWSS